MHTWDGKQLEERKLRSRVHTWDGQQPVRAGHNSQAASANLLQVEEPSLKRNLPAIDHGGERRSPADKMLPTATVMQHDRGNRAWQIDCDVSLLAVVDGVHPRRAGHASFQFPRPLLGHFQRVFDVIYRRSQLALE